MKNADLPAMPVVNGDNEPAEFDRPFYRNRNLATGLTKREMMAMHAPEMPDWFSREWSRSNEGNEQYFAESLSEYDPTCQTFLVEMTPAGHRAMYFAWRSHYADALLAELEKWQP
ncbi:hypothetical protein ACK35S_02500 [Aeromonas veronii]